MSYNLLHFQAHAKRVRETRRSTQGVTLDEIKSAEQLVKMKNANNNNGNEINIQGNVSYLKKFKNFKLSTRSSLFVLVILYINLKSNSF